MDFALSEEQRAVADMAGPLFADHCSDEQTAAHDRSGEAFDRALWRKVLDAGLHALLLPVSVGGSGLGMTDMSLVLEAQGRALASVPLWRSQLAAATLLECHFGRAQAFVPQMVAGESIATLTLDGPLRSRGLSVQAKRSKGGWILSGTAPAVPLGAQANWVLLAVEAEGATRLAVVELPRDQVGLTEGTYTDGERVADLHFEEAALADDALLPEGALAWLEPRAMACIAALQLGVTEQQLRRTVEYIGERKQFDRPIATFQAVQMKMADCFIQKEALRTSLWQLCYRLDAGLGVQAQALATLFLACETGEQVGHAAQHVHGGVGVDLTYPMHRYLYWSRALGMMLGGPNAALARLGQCLADNNRLGWKYDLEENQAV